MTHPLRRSCLSVPACSERKLASSIAAGADEVIFDLEDSVPPSEKDDARAAAVAMLGAHGTAINIGVRVNAPGSVWCHQDILAVAGLASSIVVPKVESAGDLAFVDRLLDAAEADHPRASRLRTQALIETPEALARVHEIGSCSGRLDALILGYADLAAALGRTTAGTREMTIWDPVRDTVLWAARSNGLQAIDGPYLGIEPDDRFRATATRARDLGFDGKWAIHPAQLPELNALFAPNDEDVRRAQEIIATLRGQGAVRWKGEMVDDAVHKWANRVLSRAQQAGVL